MKLNNFTENALVVILDQAIPIFSIMPYLYTIMDSIPVVIGKIIN